MAPLNGQLRTYGLEAIVRACGRKLGMFLFKSPQGEGRIYLANGVVLEAMLGGAFGLQALQSLAALEDAPYEFLPGAETRSNSLAFPAEELAQVLAAGLPAEGKPEAEASSDGWSGSDC